MNSLMFYTEEQLNAELGLAMACYENERVIYEAEMQAIEVYNKYDGNIELCTESFEIIKEGMMDKVKAAGRNIFAALRKMINAIINALSTLKTKIAKALKTPLVNTTKLHRAYDINDLKNRIDKVTKWIEDVNSSAKKVIKKEIIDNNMKVAKSLRDMVDASDGKWMYTAILDYMNKDNAPFGNNFSKSAEVYEAAEDYFMKCRINVAKIGMLGADSEKMMKKFCQEQLNNATKAVDVIKHNLQIIDNDLKAAEKWYNDEEEHTYAECIADMVRILTTVNKSVLEIALKVLNRAIEFYTISGNDIAGKYQHPDLL